MKNKEAEEVLKNHYNALVRKYFDLRRQADLVKNEIDEIQGLVEYEQ